MDAVLHEDDYLATSEGEKLPSLKSFRKNQSKLAKVSEKKSKRCKGSKSRRKLAKKEARIHQRVGRSRKDHACKTIHALLRTGKKVFFHEKLNLKGLSKRNKAKQDNSGKYLPNGQSAKSGLNKSWQDAAFGEFFKTLQHIAEKAGCKVIPVNPAYTSQLLPYKDEFLTLCALKKRRFFKTCLKGIVKYPAIRSKQLLINQYCNCAYLLISCFPSPSLLPIRYAQHPAITYSSSRTTKAVGSSL